MRSLNQYILEYLPISKLDKTPQYKYHPILKDDLVSIIRKEMNANGLKADLNCIDTSEITDMSFLFYECPFFDGDISDWDVSNVITMESMFDGSTFTGDISNWDVSNVENMTFMFFNCEFDGDLSKWDVSSVKDMEAMFGASRFTGKHGDISNWNTENVKDMSKMFKDSIYNGDISGWDVRKVRTVAEMFMDSLFDGSNGDLDNWRLHNCKTNNAFDGSPMKNNLPIWM